MPDNTELTEEYRSQISQLRSDLNQLVEQKKALVRSHRELVTKIKGTISDIKSLKERRDDCTGKVRQHKERRTEVHNSIKEKISKLHQFRETQPSDAVVHGKIPPGALRAEIRRLETRIETGAISFEEEKKLMRFIKEKQKLLKEADKVAAVFGEEKNLVTDIRQLRQESDDIHKNLQEQATESQQHHEKILEASKAIDEMRVTEADYNKRLDELSAKINDADKVLQELLGKFGKARTEEDENFEVMRKERKAKQAKILGEKERIAEEKLKTGKKLTTQDLLALQSKLAQEDALEERKAQEAAKEAAKESSKEPKQESA